MFGTIPEFNQSLDMFKTMWGQGAAAQAGQLIASELPLKRLQAGLARRPPALGLELGIGAEDGLVGLELEHLRLHPQHRNG